LPEFVLEQSVFQLLMMTVTQLEKLGESGGERLPQFCPLCGSQEAERFLAGRDRFHKRRETYQLMRCSACAMVWLADPPGPEQMSAHYGDDYYKGIAMAGEAPRRWKKQCAVISRYKQCGDILDIGCSSGGFLGTLKGGSWGLHGIEIAAPMAARARANTGAEVFVGDALSAPFAPESFDVVTCFDVLEHVYEPRRLLLKALGWLKPGGIFYTMLPNIDSWEARVFGSYWYGLELPRHISHFSPESLRRAMAAAGFEKGHIEMLPNSFLEYSFHYICDDAAEKVGFASQPLARPKQLSIPWRVVRKGLRLSVVAPLGRLASFAGAGASMEAVFVKSRESPS
jgi:SAM-dependent methyltransferase